jgi:hypothetical protein
MRVFKRGILEKLYPLPDGLNLTPVMSTRAVHENLLMSETPIPYSERVGRSKLSVFRDGSIFLRSILWTALSYNPVRILGWIGVAGMLLAGVAAALVAAAERLHSPRTLERGLAVRGPCGGGGGISVFALGSTFNYLVSLFYQTPVRQGLFGRPLFTPSLDHHFGWVGILVLLAGLVAAVISLGLGASGWDIARLWLYLLGSALMILSASIDASWVLIACQGLSQRVVWLVRTCRRLEVNMEGSPMDTQGEPRHAGAGHGWQFPDADGPSGYPSVRASRPAN